MNVDECSVASQVSVPECSVAYYVNAPSYGGTICQRYDNRNPLLKEVCGGSLFQI